MTDVLRVGDLATITMGLSPAGDTYNEMGEGIPLLNGPTDFGQRNPTAKLFTTAPKRICDIGDLIFCVRGNTTGKWNVADRPYSLGRGVAGIRGHRPMDTDFVGYALEVNLPRLLGLAGGSTMPNLRKGDIEGFEILVPRGRNTVVGIVRSFDDLIENNRRRIEILEEMARLIYREWFVHFRFPGHEDVEMVDSDLGPIPEGWNITSLDEQVALARRNVKPAMSPEEEFDHYSILAFDSDRLPTVEFGTEIKSGKYGVEADCVLLSKLNPRFPRVWRVSPQKSERRSICSTEFLVLEADDYWPSVFLYSLVSDSGFGSRLTAMAGGTSTSHQRVKPKDVMTLAVAGPPLELFGAFAEQVGPMLDLVDILILQNRILTEARDLLLPRLISGELDVSDLDLDPEPVA